MTDSDHDILIEIRRDLRNLNEGFRTFVEEQKCCNHDMDARVREIEISGSKEAGEAVKRVESLENRMDIVEKSCCGTEAVTRWYESKIGQAGLIVGILLGVAGFFLDLWFKFKGTI